MVSVFISGQNRLLTKIICNRDASIFEPVENCGLLTAETKKYARFQSDRETSIMCSVVIVTLEYNILHFFLLGRAF